METAIKEKRGIAALYALCPVRHCFILVSTAVILLHLLTRGNHELMAWLSEHVVKHVRNFQAAVTDLLPFSLAELLIAAAVFWLLGYIVYELVLIIKKDGKLKRLYKLLITPAAAGLTIYALFCMLWGVYYYGDDFISKSGLKNEKISVEQLQTVTEYFAGKCNEYGTEVERDEEGRYVLDRKNILEQSPQVYENIVKEFPCLDGPDVHAKGVICSKVMSLIDFTGFFFPFTGEANVNTDFPPSQFPATVAHELSHQRGVAKEQEANFIAVLASYAYGDTDFCYSASMLAYTHLGNALYKADYEAWEKVFMSLSPEVLTDFETNREYWDRFETPVQKVSNTVYEGFLHSYDQELGLKSYGACVDLLVNYYYETAKAENY